MTEPSFLVVRLGSLGDIVHTFPAVAGLRQSFPKAKIIWLTHPRWTSLIETSLIKTSLEASTSPLASEIWEVESRSSASVRKIISRIREQQFTAAIDYQGLWKSAMLPFFAGVRQRIGFSSQTIREFGVPILYTDRVRCERVHIADQNGELSQRAGARNAVAPFLLSVSALHEAFVLQLLRSSSIERYVVLSPAGGWRSKCWPPERYGELCQQIRRQLGLRCVVNYGPGEDNCAAAVKAASGDADPIAYNGSLAQLMVLLRNARCVVGGDTGPLHLGVALGTPVAALFGPTDPARNGPYSPGTCGEKLVVLRSHDAKTTHRRGDQPDPSLLALDVPTVFEAVRKQIEARR